MAEVNAYASVDQLRQHLGEGDVSIIGAEMLERAVNAASRSVDRYCRRRFWLDASVTTRTFMTPNGGLALVDDIGSTTGLVVKTDDGLTGTFATTWASTDYQLEPLNGGVEAAGDEADAFSFWRIRATGTRFFVPSAVRATLQVTARFGWSSVPVDVQEATLLKAAALFKRKDAPFGVAGFNDFGPVRIGRNDPDVIELLGNYRRMVA